MLGQLIFGRGQDQGYQAGRFAVEIDLGRVTAVAGESDEGIAGLDAGRMAGQHQAPDSVHKMFRRRQAAGRGAVGGDGAVQARAEQPVPVHLVGQAAGEVDAGDQCHGVHPRLAAGPAFDIGRAEQLLPHRAGGGKQVVVGGGEGGVQCPQGGDDVLGGVLDLGVVGGIGVEAGRVQEGRDDGPDVIAAAEVGLGERRDVGGAGVLVDKVFEQFAADKVCGGRVLDDDVNDVVAIKGPGLT